MQFNNTDLLFSYVSILIPQLNSNRSFKAICKQIIPLLPLEQRAEQEESGSLETISCSFDSFFKVLFTVPSQYFFAIGVSKYI